MGAHLLIVEDDRVLSQQLCEQMALFGHSSDVAFDGQSALIQASEQPFDVIVLDRAMPNLDGMHVVRELREANVGVPIVMLTALGLPSQKVEGLDVGADDYMVKPADPDELNARINSLLRARHRNTGQSSETIRVGEIVISPTRFAAWRNGRLLYLQNIEMRILLVLARNSDSVVTRAMLLEQVWNYDFEPATNLVEVYIGRLRKKLSERGEDDPIRTIRGIGYMLKA